MPGNVNLPSATGCWQERYKLRSDQNKGTNLCRRGRVKRWHSFCPHLPRVINSPSCFLLRLYKLQCAGCHFFGTSPFRRLWSLLCYFMSITKCCVFQSAEHQTLQVQPNMTATWIPTPLSQGGSSLPSAFQRCRCSFWGGTTWAIFKLSQVTISRAPSKTCLGGRVAT